MKRIKRSLLSLLAMILLISTIGMQQASASWLEGFVIEALKPVAEALKENTPDPAAIYADEAMRLVNLEREKHELAPVSSNEALKKAADTRAKELTILFAHKRPNGSSPRTVFEENELEFRYVGENIAHGFAEPAALVAAWMDSPAHRAAILRGEYTHGELGYFQAENGNIFCSLLLYTPIEG